MNTLISMTGKTSKKSKGVGRPRKNQTKHEIWKELIRDIGEDEVARIFRELIEEGDDKAGKKIQQIINKTKLSSRDLTAISDYSNLKFVILETTSRELVISIVKMNDLECDSRNYQKVQK